jgi:hypothetical protein
VAETRTLSIQSVLYLTAPDAAQRLARTVVRSATEAQNAGVVASWDLAFGDSSPTPALTKPQVAALTTLCRAAGGEFRYDFFDGNLGHGGGHNRLAEGRSTGLILFLNPDALLAPGTVFELVGALGDGVGATDARQLPLEHPKDYARGTGDESWASGACMLTPRAVFDTVGGFDAGTFFMYCDDVDYSWRVRLAGFRVVFAPAARVFHDKRLDASGAYQPGDAEVYYSAEAAILLAHKYSRPARVRSLTRRYRREATEPVVRAVSEYLRRRAEGRLPTPLDKSHRVGEFVGDNYARRRY